MPSVSHPSQKLIDEAAECEARVKETLADLSLAPGVEMETQSIPHSVPIHASVTFFKGKIRFYATFGHKEELSFILNTCVAMQERILDLEQVFTIDGLRLRKVNVEYYSAHKSLAIFHDECDGGDDYDDDDGDDEE